MELVSLETSAVVVICIASAVGLLYRAHVRTESIWILLSHWRVCGEREGEGQRAWTP